MVDFYGASAIDLLDGYKLDHRRQYPKETKLVYSNFTPRKSRVKGVSKIVWAGGQFFLKHYLLDLFNETFFKADINLVAEEYAAKVNHYLPPGHGITFEHIRDLHALGFLPLRIKSLPEGAVVPMKIAPLTIRNTEGHEKEFFWLVNYLETIMSLVLWGPSTSATTAFEHLKIFTYWADKTVGNREFVPFQGHDFSARGMFGAEAMFTSAFGHATSFKGSDTFAVLGFLRKYYNADYMKEFVVGSVAATEHSVMCLGTGLYIYDQADGDWSYIGEAEFSVFKRLLTEVYPTGIVSIVSDTFNLWKVLTVFLPQMKELILARDGKIVIRPDSGDPVDIITGQIGGVILEKALEYEEAIRKGVVELLWDTFGGTITEKGYRLLDFHVGTIYGDSINTERNWSMNSRLADKNFASINWVGGIGSFSYQYVTRDTYGWAMKATYGEVLSSKGERLQIPVFKDPFTDDGTKKSARGLLRVEKDLNGNYYMLDQQTWKQEEGGELKAVFSNGELYNETSLADIRIRLQSVLDREIAGIEERYTLTEAV